MTRLDDSDRRRWIVSYADNLKHDARSVAWYVAGLASRPDYETLAFDAMEQAETALAEALTKVQEAKTIYMSKKVEPNVTTAA